MKIVHIPLDSRPCNGRFPGQIAAMAGAELLVPPTLDHFDRPAEYQAVEDFLQSAAPCADGLVISLDQWCFGSLLASRDARVTREEALGRLERLERILRENPGLPVSAYSVVMRSSISTLNKQDLPYYDLMTAYSQQWHRARLSGAREEREALERLEKQIPAELLKRYAAVRQRNHAVNLRAVEMCQAGLWQKLLLLQEDAQPLGFHRVEQEALRLAAGQDERVYLHNGADEAGMLLTADMACRAQKPLKLRVAYLQGDGRFYALFEDRPFCENVASHSRAAGVELVETGEDCVLCVALPKSGSQTEQPGDGEEDAEECARQIAAQLDGGKPVALLDVRRVNGGDLRLLDALGAANLSRLVAYAAWNTASNSLGTVLAQLRATGGVCGEEARAFTLERLLDDGLYQGDVRQRLQKRLAARGEDIYRLSHKREAEALLRELLADALAQSPVLQKDAPWEACLPWERTFEADIRVRPSRRDDENGSV